MNKQKLILRGGILIVIGIIFLVLAIFDLKKDDNKELEKMEKIIIIVNNVDLEVLMEDNSSAKAFIEKLKNGDITIEAEDYGNFEKVGNLGFSLPTNDKMIKTEPGDLILYQGDKITLYYDTNTWSFTKLGHINKTKAELKNILGDGSVSMTFKLNLE